MAEGNRFSSSRTERDVLIAVASSGPAMSSATLDAAQARLAELRKEAAVDAVIASFKAADGPAKQPGPKQPAEVEAAVIEVVESRPLPEEHQGVMKPNEVRINGVPVLVPRTDFIEIEHLDDGWDGGGDGLIVRLRVFARRVVIGEAL